MQMQLSAAQFLASEAIRPRILVVDDEPMICELLSAVLEDEYQVVCATTSKEALRVLAEQRIDVLLLDYHLLLGGAGEVAKQADDIGIPLAWMTGDHAVEIKSQAVLLKPFYIERVSQVLTDVRASARLVINPLGQQANSAA